MGEPQTAWQLIRNAPGPFFGWTFLIAAGVMSAWCGIGFLLMTWGSAMLLAHAADTAGYSPPTAGQKVVSGALAMGLACAIFAAALTGGFAMRQEPETFAAAMTLAVLLVGAILAPLALGPIAAATGARGVLGPVGEGIDLAGADHFGRLAPLCATIAGCVFLPIPGVLFALVATRDHPAWLLVAAAVFGLWMLAVPMSAGALTLRVRALHRSEHEATGVGDAGWPVLGAMIIGLVAVTAGFVTQAARPQLSRHGLPDASELVAGSTVELPSPELRLTSGYVPVSGTDVELDLSRYGEQISVRTPTGHDYYRLEPRLGGSCHVDRRRAGGLVVACANQEGATHLELDVLGRPTPPTTIERLRVGMLSGGAMTLACVLLGLVLFLLGRLGRAVRLLQSKPFTYEGTVDDDELVFLTKDGAHRVRVPVGQLDGTFYGFIGRREPAVLVSPEGLPPIGLRTAETPCPPRALLVIGTVEDAIAKHVTRARKIGFRFGVASLALFVLAAIALIARV